MVLFSGCPSDCLSCTVKADETGTECKAEQCASGYILKVEDKTCQG